MSNHTAFDSAPQGEPQTNLTPKRPELGSWHTLHARASKHSRNHHTNWFRMSYHTPRAGMYIGWRTVYDGATDWDWEYEGGYLANWSFKRKGQHEVWLFVIDPRQNPVAVFPFDATPTAQQEGGA